MIGVKTEQKFSWLFRYVVLTSMVEPQKVPMAAADDHVVRLQPLQNVGKPSAAFSLSNRPGPSYCTCTYTQYPIIRNGHIRNASEI